MAFSRKAGKEETSSSSNVHDPVKLGIARYLAWVLLILILCFAILLAILFGNRARDTLLTKQRNFAGILAEHLNQQIFVRFSIPVVANYGRLNLKQNAQYVMLDKTVESLTHGLQVHRLRIIDKQGEIKYSSYNRDEVGFKSRETEEMTRRAEEMARRAEEVAQQVEGGQKITDARTAAVFVVDRNISLWQTALLSFRKKRGAFYLRTIFAMRPVYSLRVENTASYTVETGPSLGVLELTQDITGDMADIVAFQWTIVGITLASASLLFFLLMAFLRKAEAALALRMREQQRLQSELHQHEKLAGMGRVVAGIAHEIRNPLGIIRSSAELLLSRPGGADPVTGKILRAIFDEARRLSQTVSDFIDYARPRQPRQEKLDAGKTLQAVLAFLEPETVAKGVAISVVMEGATREDAMHLPTIGDTDLLYRAFYNILTNSIQAMEQGGAITVSGKISVMEEGSFIEFGFADTGPGFPENRERMLDPFVTTKDDGTGLGLPIVNSIITSHGGMMYLEDAPGGGALVRVFLPCPL